MPDRSARVPSSARVPGVLTPGLIEWPQFNWKRQRGFRQNDSTQLTITTIYDEFLKNFGNKLITCALCLDISNAFDCCDHEVALGKLYHYVIRGVLHKLFSNYVHNRMQCTKTGASKYSYKKMSYGVFQGSVLAPWFFSTYINGITQASTFHTILQYLPMIITFVCPAPVLVFFRQLPNLHNTKLTTGLNFRLITIRLTLC